MDKQNSSLELFTNLPRNLAGPISKAQFAREVGLSRGRISQLISQGLPVREDGKVDREAASSWMEKNLDPTRRKPTLVGEVEDASLPNSVFKESPSLKDLKSAHESVKMELTKLQYERERGNLVNREDVERVILNRARQERDAHLAWTVRIAPIVAGELGIECERVFPILNRLMREHLENLSDTPLGNLKNVQRN